jgi:hypothetical protein
MNIFKWLFNIDWFTFHMGGGGGPTQTTSYQTNIPEYAQPYVEQMLGATQRQVYTGKEVGGQFTPTGFQQYIPYGSTFQTNAQGQPVRDAQGQIIFTNTPTQQAQAAVAGLTPLQQQAISGIGGYINPQQTAAASQIAGGVAGQSVAGGYYSPLVAERFQLGRPQQVYSDSFTAPGVSRAYMSPYMQNVVNAQQREARRASEIARNQQQAQAVGQGAYGGSRQAIVEAERQRNLATQLGDIQAQGLQQAYGAGMGQFNAEQAAYLQAQQANQNANLQAAVQNLQAQQAAQQLQEQSRQFGANLGLQGYGQSLNAAQLLSQQGAQEYQQDMATLQAQLQAGGLDQAQQQQVINQAIQNYATQQQYPLMQLGVLSNMLRGLPMQAVTTQAYQAQPSAFSQAAGVLGTGLGLVQQYNTAFPGGKKEGGVVKLAPGGIATGVSEGKLTDMAKMMRDKDLQAKMQDAETDPATKEIFQSETMRRQHLRGMAGGGIVAFAGGGTKGKKKEKEDPTIKQMREEVGGGYTDTSGEKNPEVMSNVQTSAPDVQDMPNPVAPTAPAAPAATGPATDLQSALTSMTGRQTQAKGIMEKSVPQLMGDIAKEREQLGIVDPMAGRRTQLEERKAKIDAETQELAKMRLSEFLVRWGNTPGSALRGAVSAGQQLIADQITDAKERKRLNDQLEDSLSALNEAEYLRKTGDADKAQARIDQAGKDYYTAAKDIAGIQGKLKGKEIDAATREKIQQLRNSVSHQNKTAVIQIADRYNASDVAAGMPADDKTYAAALKRAIDDYATNPRAAMAAISAGPAYARVGLEGERLSDVDINRQRRDDQKAFRDEVFYATQMDPVGRARVAEAREKDSKAGLKVTSPGSAEAALLKEISDDIKANYPLLNKKAAAAATPAPKTKEPKEPKKEEPKPSAPALRWDPEQKKWVK